MSIHLALRRDIVRRAVRVAVVVGTLLVVINHGDALLAGTVDVERLLRIALTYLVPYGVSTYSSVQALKR